jgi:transcriptional regulator with XRE-family HTH domain
MSTKDNPVRLHRLRVGLSIAELARRLGVHRSSLVAIEVGQTRHPTEETLHALSRHFQVPSSQLSAELEAWHARQVPVWTIPQRRILAQGASQIPLAYPSFRAWRQHLGVPYARMAAAMGVSRSSLSEYEAGRRQEMPDSLMAGLMRLGLPADVVLALAELPPSTPATDEEE